MGTVAAAAVLVMLSVTPSNGGPLSPPQITINDATNNQVDPHVDGNTAAYSNEIITSVGDVVQEIRYYDFATNQDLGINNLLSTGVFANDLLSDVDQGRIVFTRRFPDHSGIMLFD